VHIWRSAALQSPSVCVCMCVHGNKKNKCTAMPEVRGSTWPNQLLSTAAVFMDLATKTVSAHVQYLKDQRNYLVKIAFLEVARSMTTAVHHRNPQSICSLHPITPSMATCIMSSQGEKLLDSVTNTHSLLATPLMNGTPPLL
jgi:hypothetical protein